MTAADSVFAGSAITALGLAAARTVESSRPDRLIDDPLAAYLFRTAGVELPMRLTWPEPGQSVTEAEALHLHGSRYIGLRTRFYDDLLTSATEQGINVGVLIGAGLDTRSYRLPLPDRFSLFELDQGALVNWKRDALARQPASPRCRRSAIGVDLRDDWSADLCRHGFDPARPAVFIAEGLLPYLSPQEQLVLLDRLDHIAAAGSLIAFDQIVGDPHAPGRVQGLSRRSGIDMNDLLASGEGAFASSWLRDRGWTVCEQSVEAIAQTYGRDLSNPLPENGAAVGPEPPWLDTVFVTATS